MQNILMFLCCGLLVGASPAQSSADVIHGSIPYSDMTVNYICTNQTLALSKTGSIKGYHAADIQNPQAADETNYHLIDVIKQLGLTVDLSGNIQHSP